MERSEHNSNSNYVKKPHTEKREEQSGEKRNYSENKFVKKPRFAFKRKKCRFCSKEKKNIDKELNYKNIDTLQKFLSDRGKILPSRLTGNCSIHQRKLKVEIKKARYIALLPFVKVEKINK